VDTYSTQFADPSVQKTNAAIASFLRVPFPGMIPVESELDGYNLWSDNEGTSYANEMIIKFIGGEEPLDNWDQFIAQLKKLGVDEITAAKQSMYDRYKSF
jgi:putative aldouronate transport system substrate-binding protein